MSVDAKSVKPTSAPQRRFRPEVYSKDIIRFLELTYCSNKSSYVTNGTGIRLLSGRLQHVFRLCRGYLLRWAAAGGPHSFLHADMHSKSNSAKSSSVYHGVGGLLDGIN